MSARLFRTASAPVLTITFSNSEHVRSEGAPK
jgi:hypothetical protein